MTTETQISNYDRGLKTGNEMKEVTIALNNVWGGRSKDGGHVSSYEKIGHHAGSVEFLDGVLASGYPVRQYVEVDGRIDSYLIESNPFKK